MAVLINQARLTLMLSQIRTAAQCYARQCYGSLREFTLIVTDNDDNRLLYLQRPLRCSSRCFYSCCCLQEMRVFKPPDVLLAVVRERYSDLCQSCRCLLMCFWQWLEKGSMIYACIYFVYFCMF